MTTSRGTIEENLHSLRTQLQGVSPRFFSVHALVTRRIPREILLVRAASYDNSTNFKLEELRNDVFKALDNLVCSVGGPVPVLLWGDKHLLSDEQYARLKRAASQGNNR